MSLELTPGVAWGASPKHSKDPVVQLIRETFREHKPERLEAYEDMNMGSYWYVDLPKEVTPILGREGKAAAKRYIIEQIDNP